MNKHIKEVLILVIIGFCSGLAIGFCFLYLGNSSYNSLSDITWTGARVFQFLVGGIHGAIAMGTTFVYQIERWSILRCTFTHFIICMASFFAMAAIQGWLDFSSSAFIAFLVIMVICYIIIWMMQYLTYRHMVRMMNEELDKIKKNK